jgi:Domain of unknown function DUF1828
MICQHLSAIAGIECMPMDAAGDVACIFLPLTYTDGDGMHLYVERMGTMVKFTDGGDAALHFAGRGVALNNARKTLFLKNAAAPSGVTLTADNTLETIVPEDQASEGFGAMFATMVRLKDWESDNLFVEGEESNLAAEVEYLLRQLSPHAIIERAPVFVGFTKHEYRLDLVVDGRPVVAVGSHHQAIAAAIKKLLDIRSNPDLAGLNMLVVFDDRGASTSAIEDATLLETVGTVTYITALEARALGLPGVPH